MFLAQQIELSHHPESDNCEVMIKRVGEPYSRTLHDDEASCVDSGQCAGRRSQEPALPRRKLGSFCNYVRGDRSNFSARLLRRFAHFYRPGLLGTPDIHHRHNNHTFPSLLFHEPFCQMIRER
jgi:hypothetical protein